VYNVKKMKISKNKILLGTLFIIAIWIVSGIAIYYFIKPTERGTFGDMFGAVNSLFSGLALFGIILSILIQQKEFNLQTNELRDTKLEFKTNRITTIMFKQLDYLNSIIDKAVFFLKDPINNKISKTKIDEFIYSMDEIYLYSNKITSENLSEENQRIIRVTSSRIITILDGLDNLLKSYNLDKTESKQMRKIFKMNINPSFLKLLFYKSLFVKQEFSEDIEIKGIEKLIITSDTKQYKRIKEFGEED
jgi:hypothetical protein